MKSHWKMIGILLCVLCVIALAGCSKKKANENQEVSAGNEETVEATVTLPKEEKEPSYTEEETTEAPTEETSIEEPKLPIPSPFEGSDDIKLPDVEVDWGDIEEPEEEPEEPEEEKTYPTEEEPEVPSEEPEEAETTPVPPTEEDKREETDETGSDIDMPDSSIGEDDF